MEILLGSLAGVLMAASVWLMLSRNLVKFLLGLVLIGNVANLVIFASGGLTYGAPPLIADGATVPAETVANALPQALILTAIVIGFGLVAFTLVLALRAYQEIGTVNVDAMNLAEGRTAAIDREKADVISMRDAA
ncbi:MAG: Na+/H+ antiporter subunit C [Pseudomonadota bacterium]